MGTTERNSIASIAVDQEGERERSRRLAERYRCPFVDLREQRIDPELFRSIPADLMFRYNFVPIEPQNNALVVAVADPSQVLLSDELPLLLGKKLIIKVATASQIGDLLKRTEQSQRVLEQATEAFTLQVVQEEEETEETISADRVTRDAAVSPVVRLVDTVIFTTHREGVALHHPLPHQGDERTRYRRAPCAPGRPVPRPLQRPACGLPRLHHAFDSR